MVGVVGLIIGVTCLVLQVGAKNEKLNFGTNPNFDLNPMTRHQSDTVRIFVLFFRIYIILRVVRNVYILTKSVERERERF
jgi:hypothetical protein